jgi:hypothetical protein
VETAKFRLLSKVRQCFSRFVTQALFGTNRSKVPSSKDLCNCADVKQIFKRLKCLRKEKDFLKTVFLQREGRVSIYGSDEKLALEFTVQGFDGKETVNFHG